MKNVLPHVFLALVGAGLVGFGCAGLLGRPASPALTAFECRAAVLEPYVADAAPLVVAQIHSGSVNPVQLLQSLGLTVPEIVAVAKAYVACAPAAPEPAAPTPASITGA